MAEAVDLGVGSTAPPHRRGVLTLAVWVEATFGRAAGDLSLYERALTHGSHGADTYERLEFLGDRVLGLAMAEWLFELFPHEPEGQLSKRLNALVTGPVCAEVAREMGVRPHLRLGKQARDDGATDSDNILGDVTEALIGAFYREAGWEPARRFVRDRWAGLVHARDKAPQHPKSALQEWAAAKGRRAPEYAILDRSGPGHAPVFRVQVAVGKLVAEASGGSKQEAETAAARALLESVA